MARMTVHRSSNSNLPGAHTVSWKGVPHAAFDRPAGGTWNPWWGRDVPPLRDHGPWAGPNTHRPWDDPFSRMDADPEADETYQPCEADPWAWPPPAAPEPEPPASRKRGVLR